MHNRRNQVAAKSRPPRGRSAKSAAPPQFPGDVTIPPHRGASLKTVELPVFKSAVPARVAAQPLFALPGREPPERLRTPAKPKQRKAPAKRRKPSGKVRSAKAAKPRPSPAEALAAFALPQRDEPLVIVHPAPVAPASGQSRALAVVRPAGLLGAIGSWLGNRAQRLWQQLGSAGPAPRGRAELRRLREENARLKAQLEAFAALQANTAFAPPDRVNTPVA